MLTAKSTEIDRVLGLEMGADDYLQPKRQRSRICGAGQRSSRRIDNLGKPKDSAPAVIETMACLDVEAGQCHDRWKARGADRQNSTCCTISRATRDGSSAAANSSTKCVGAIATADTNTPSFPCINRLRTKIEAGPDEQRFVQTVWGAGHSAKRADVAPLRTHRRGPDGGFSWWPSHLLATETMFEVDHLSTATHLVIAAVAFSLGAAFVVFKLLTQRLHTLTDAVD